MFTTNALIADIIRSLNVRSARDSRSSDTWDHLRVFFRAGHKAKSEHFHAEAELVNIMAIFSIRSSLSRSLVHGNSRGYRYTRAFLLCPLAHHYAFFASSLIFVGYPARSRLYLAIQYRMDAALPFLKIS